ncbi:carbon-nitrogen family hydrolase [Priestia aryabhattai]|uniref:carbon-nitrogen family hydrolase n=1 Tax=Priestia TaxID=2800373 RepID=UPI0008DD8F7F|nr:carbon-nitrogen family hydrolase [Priestia aryabhattai]MBX9969366.1 carbon-nitrogen family hydrolase [Priestia aryabhattai]MBZ6489179.1 carbon-nitrogen family hydrolase [Priestia aryabhattai]MDH3115743.1 carbon-nitrogen family hydrolase [Priestia aryabhattai]MDH3125363.1 carbon-nitrogen family hydrolase [Priestia aryabhattai]MDH3134411.1 carbon-nitrogen family hydrolase [Priestia aryabhattai]
MSVKITCLQLDIAFGNPTKNRKYIQQKMMEAMKENPDILVLPELWDTAYDLTRLDEIADEEGQQAKQLISQFAKTNEVNIVAGSIAKKTEQGVTNTMYIFDRKGREVSQYSKLHLFKLMDEHLYLEAGTAKNLFTLEQSLCAGVICYDIRFPEWIRVHTSSGAEVLFVVAQWPAPRLAHWKALLISRAIENQCYVIACNRVGQDPNNTFAGHSLVIDPWGEIIAEAGDSEELLSADVNLELVKEIRKQIPVFTDRRTEFY